MVRLGTHSNWERFQHQNRFVTSEKCPCRYLRSNQCGVKSACFGWFHCIHLVHTGCLHYRLLAALSSVYFDCLHSLQFLHSFITLCVLLISSNWCVCSFSEFLCIFRWPANLIITTTNYTSTDYIPANSSETGIAHGCCRFARQSCDALWQILCMRPQVNGTFWKNWKY